MTVLDAKKSLRADDYRGRANQINDGAAFTSPERRGFTSINVLEFLNGRAWDEIALAYLAALRPSVVRVVTDGVQLDSCLWRVTVWLKRGGQRIDYIEQEVTVGLPEGVEHADDLANAVHKTTPRKKRKSP